MARQTYTKERVLYEIAPRFANPSAMSVAQNGAYRHAVRNRYLPELRKVMGLEPLPEWTLDKAKKALAGCTTVKQCKDRNGAAWSFVTKNGFRNEFELEREPNVETSVTVWSIFRAARKCENRTEFRKRFSNEARWAEKWGVYERATQHIPDRHTDWNERAVRDHFATAKNRKVLLSAARSAAKRLGVYDDLIDTVPNMLGTSGPRLWTRDRILEVCNNYSDFTQLMLDHPGLRAAVERLNMEEEAYGHTNRRNTWSDDSCLEDAKRYKHLSEWAYGGGGAYHYAKHKDRPEGFFDRVVKEAGLVRAGGSLHNVIYLWQIAGTDIFKVGTTSKKPGMGTRRVYFVAKKLGVKPVIHRHKYCENATSLEVKLLGIGMPVKMIVSGGSDFRRFTDDELATAIRLIDDATQNCSESED